MSTNFHTAWVDASTQMKASSMNPALAALDAAIAARLSARAVVALADTAVTLTAANLVTSGIITAVPTTARNQQLPTAANIIAALPVSAVGTCFEFSFINTAAYDETLTTNTNLTLVGSMVVNNTSASFLVLVTGAAAVTIYRK